jgi:signal transduction histidine kinase
MMGFVLELESTPGQGSTFRVRFPGGGSLPV